MANSHSGKSQSATSRTSTPNSSQQRITDMANMKKHTTRANDDPMKKSLDEMINDVNWNHIKDASQAHKYLKGQGLTTAEPQGYSIRDIARTLLHLTYSPASDSKVANGVRAVALLILTLEDSIEDIIKTGNLATNSQTVNNSTEDLVKRIEQAMEVSKSGTESATRALTEAKAISEKISTQNSHLENLATSLSDNIKQSLESVANTLVQNIKNAANEVNEKVNTASKAINEATTELNAAKRTYSQAAQTPIPNRTTTTGGTIYTSPLIEDEREKEIRDKAKRGILKRQILINPISRTGGNSFMEDISQEGIREKANEALKSIAGIENENENRTHDKIEFIRVRKLNNGGIVLEINDDNAAEILRDEEIKRKFLKKFDPDNATTIKEREYQVIAFGVPIHFDIESKDEWREVEESNTNVEHESIVKARWVKPPRRRAPGQERANVIFHFIDPRSANYAIMKGLYISGRRISCERIRKEPLRCMKCQLYDHLTHSCMAEEACSQCGKNHKSEHCTNRSDAHCVACNADTHSSWDRTCPVFLEKCDKLNSRLLENSRPFYPIDHEPWTLVTIPPNLPRNLRPQAIRDKIEEVDREQQFRQTTLDDAFAKAQEKLNNRTSNNEINEINDDNGRQDDGDIDITKTFNWNFRGSVPPRTHSPRAHFADDN